MTAQFLNLNFELLNCARLNYGRTPQKGSNRDEMYECQEDQYEALDGVSRTNSEDKMAQLNQELEENQPKAPVPQKFADIRDARLRDSEDRQLHET